MLYNGVPIKAKPPAPRGDGPIHPRWHDAGFWAVVADMLAVLDREMARRHERKAEQAEAA